MLRLPIPNGLGIDIGNGITLDWGFPNLGWIGIGFLPAPQQIGNADWKWNHSD